MLAGDGFALFHDPFRESCQNRSGRHFNRQPNASFIGRRHGVGPVKGTCHIEGQIVGDAFGLPEYPAGTAAQVGDGRPPEADVAKCSGQYPGRFTQQRTMGRDGDGQPVGSGRAFFTRQFQYPPHGLIRTGDHELVGGVEVGDENGMFG